MKLYSLDVENQPESRTAIATDDVSTSPNSSVCDGRYDSIPVSEAALCRLFLVHADRWTRQQGMGGL